MSFTLYRADCVGNRGNCLYPNKIEIIDEASLKDAVKCDYVCAEYKNSYRSGANFMGSDCLPVDCDNDHSENPSDWVNPCDVTTAFPNVRFAIHYSRNHMKDKNDKAARPKFHVLFPIDHVTDSILYAQMKKLVCEIFPFFDTQALDSARFFFGTAQPEVEMYPNSKNLTDFLTEDDFDTDLNMGGQPRTIAEGSRNATMSRFAGRVLKRYGDTEEAHGCFLEEANKCIPPLEATELATIWRSAKSFFQRVALQDGYVPPEVYNSDVSYKPGDYSDVGQASALTKHFGNELRYSPATHYIRYFENYWQETEPGAQAVAQELTRRQLDEATHDLLTAMEKLKNVGAQDILETTSKAKAVSLFNDSQAEAYEDFLAAKAYQTFSIKRRESKSITATLREAHPMLEISPRDLDTNCFLLCTPSATYDLRKGMTGDREHSPEDWIILQK